MTIRARMKVEEPEKISMTLTMTMSMKEWEELREHLTAGYPAWKLTSAINNMLSAARKIYFAPDMDAFGEERQAAE